MRLCRVKLNEWISLVKVLSFWRTKFEDEHFCDIIKNMAATTTVSMVTRRSEG